MKLDFHTYAFFGSPFVVTTVEIISIFKFTYLYTIFIKAVYMLY